MSYESAFFKNLVGGTLTELTKGGFVSFGSPHSIGISENSTPALEPPVSPSSHQEWDISRFRHWWWDEFDTGADDAEFDEGSPEAAQDLLPILRVLKASLPFKSVLAILSSFRGWWWVPLRSRKKTLTPALSLNGDFEKH